MDLEEEDENPNDDGGDSEYDFYLIPSVQKPDRTRRQVGTLRTSRSPKSAALAYTTSCSRFTGVKARQHAKDMGVPVDNRIHASRSLAELQIEERRRKVQQAQETSNCRSCGLTGTGQE